MTVLLLDAAEPVHHSEETRHTDRHRNKGSGCDVEHHKKQQDAQHRVKRQKNKLPREAFDVKVGIDLLDGEGFHLMQKRL